MSDFLSTPAAPETPDSFGSGPAEPTVAEKAEAALDEAIDKALGPDEDEPAPAKKGARAEADPEDDEADELELDDEDEDEGILAANDEDDEGAGDGDEPDAGEAADEDDDEDMALHRAYTRLYEKGFPAKVLKRTPKDELIAWANRVGDEPASTKDATSKTERTRETPGDAKGAKAEPAKDTWADIRRGFAEKFGIDEDAADALKPLHDRNEALEAKTTALESKLDQVLAASAQREGQITIDKELRRLGAKYPELRRDETKRDALVDKVTTIIAGLKAKKAEIDVRQVFDDAARMVATGGPKRDDLAHKRRNGFSSPPETLGNSRMETLDEDGYWSKAIDLAYAGKKDAIARLKPPLPPKRR